MQKKLIALCALAALPAAAQAGSLYTFESGADGFHTKTHFYDTGAEVVAFDAQFTPGAAEAALLFLREKTASPLKYLVITHPNPDKFNGAPVFRAAGATVIASERTARAMPAVHAYKQNFFENVARMFPAGTYPALAGVDKTFGETLELAGGLVKLRELSQPGVSGNQTIAFLPAENAVVVGDLVHGKAHAWLEGGIVNGGPKPSLAGWIADLAELKNLPGLISETLVFGGRGEVLPLAVAVEDQVSYLKAADEIVAKYVASLPDAAAELGGTGAGAHFQAIEKELAARFPGYSLSYLVQYGVYGLALQKL
jgi:glyoxylase-like metal-dependent hydrolase (beta-lactamase superfamily II)